MLDNIIIIGLLCLLAILFILTRRTLKNDVEYKSINDLLWLKIENNILLKVDVQRVKHDKKQLQKDDNCYHLAQQRSYQAYMFYKNTGGLTTDFHKSLFQTDQFKAMRKLGLSVIRENVARGYQPEDVVRKWVESEKHFKNLLSDYKYTGISSNQYDGVWYHTQIFAK